MDNKSAIWIAGAILVVGVAYIVFVGRPSVVAAECTLPNGGINKYCLEAGGRLEWDKKRAEEYEAAQAQPPKAAIDPSWPTYEVDIGDATYEVTAPDEKTAWLWANAWRNTREKPALVDEDAK